MTPDDATWPRASDDDDAPREACGLFGVFNCPNAPELIRDGLFSQQHRGEEAAGITVYDGQRVRTAKGEGLVAHIANLPAFADLAGHRGIGHNRYSTTGASRAHNVQPLVGECVDGIWAVAHNGTLVNANALRRSFQEQGSLFQTGTDSELLLHLLAAPRHRNRPDRVLGALAELRGAYSFLIMNETQLMAARDPRGFKPLVMGRLGEGYLFASETCAITQVGGVFEREVDPGELVVVDDQGVRSYFLEDKPPLHAHCIFELVYFARPDSFMFDQWVYETRLKHGRRLAREHPVEADYVVSVPDSGNFAALGYSQESGVPLGHGFIRNHYVGRTFILPGQEKRMSSADQKLSVLPNALIDKRIVVVDDSLVRGTTMRKRVASLKKAGAKEVHLRIACPPVAHPCYYGIDFPTRAELAAATRSVEEIREMVAADSLGYLSEEGLVSPFPVYDGFCRACFNGHYPIETGCPDKQACEGGCRTC